MDIASPASRITLPLAPAGAGLLAALTGMAVLVAPTTLLESFALDSGIAAIVAAAEPPLSVTARLALTVMAATGVFAAAWVLLDLLGPGRQLGFTIPEAILGGAAREPVRAGRDLGVPFLEVQAGRAKALPAVVPDIERPLPRDLDLPLSFFDPGAVPSAPAQPVPLVPALARPAETALELTVRAPAAEPADTSTLPKPELVLEAAVDDPVADAPAQKVEPSPASPPAAAVEFEAEAEAEAQAEADEPAERWEVIELPTPPVTRLPQRTERPSEATIQALLARLERGMADKASSAEPVTSTPPAAAAPWPSLADTLGELRALAANRS